MVRKVLADSKDKLEKSAAQSPDIGSPQEKQAQQVQPAGVEAEKVASALDYLADNLHLVYDNRSPQEKLAEFAALGDAVIKQAMGDESQGSHQTQKAPESHQSPMSPGMTGDQAGAGSNQVQSEANTQSGDGVLEAGQTGEATSEKVNPMSVEPTENTFPGDSSGGALESTQDEADRPGGKETAPMKIAHARAVKLASMVSSGQVSPKVAAAIIKKDQAKVAETAGVPAPLAENAAQTQAIQNPAQPGAETLGGGTLAKKAEEAGVPPHLASALIKKFAADAENPAQISAGSTPELQSASGAPPVQSQGTPAGEGVPDTKGSDQGRDAIQSVTAAINATKDELKGRRTRSEMSKHLDEPAFSAANDKTLQQSLENASSAGVKIATTEMLQKWASESPERSEKLQAAIAKIKLAQPPAGPPMPPPPEEGPAGPMPPEAGGAGPLPPGMGAGAPPESLPMPGGAEGEMGDSAEPVSDAALAAAAQGVDPEELAQAEAMLEQQVGAAEGAMAEGGGGEMAGVPGGPEAQGAPPAEPAPPVA
jgi:hypothetical protein